MASGKLKGKWKLIVGIAAGIIIAGLAGWYFLGSKSTAPAQTVSVPVTKGTIDVQVSGTGHVEPADTRNVIAKAGGTISRINVVNGQRVSKGQLLFQLDASSLQSQIEKARLDQRQTQLDLGNTGQQLEQRQVYAPMSGRVTSIEVVKGQDVQKGSALMTIQDTNNLTFQIPFNDVSSITVGQNADVIITDLGASGITGKVTQVNRAAVADSNGTLVYYVTISIGNPGALVPGMQAQAAVHTAKGVIDGYTTGPLEWAADTIVRAGISGVLTQLNVEENYVVKKGQLLASLSSETLGDQIKSQSIKLQQSQLSISDLQKQMADYMIYAPADGTFTMTASSDSSKNSSGSSSNSNSNSGSSGSIADTSGKWQVGDEIKAGQVVGTIDNASGMVVTVPIDEVDISKIKLGQKADITFDALPDRKFTGSVSEISDQGVVSNSMATFDVKVALDKTDGVKSGMTANVEILVAHKADALLVPIEAVQERQGKKFVFLDASGAVRGRTPGLRVSRSSGDSSRTGSGSGFGAGSDNRDGGADNGSRSGAGSGSGSAMAGRMTLVETGLYNETSIEITNGLKEGDKVVIPSVARSSSNNGRNRSPFGGGMGGGRPGGGGTGTGGVRVNGGDFH